MVSTISCPQCGTKNSKLDEVCYKCKKRLKTRKKSEILKFNPKSKIDLKIIAIGVILFVMSNAIVLNIASDYSALVSGSVTMLYLYLVFKNAPQPENSQNNTRSMGLKIVFHYLIMIILGIAILAAFRIY